MADSVEVITDVTQVTVTNPPPINVSVTQQAPASLEIKLPGPQGPAGGAWFNGTAPPSAATGANGDYYIVTSGTGTGNVYRKDATNTWVLQGNISGPTTISGGLTTDNLVSAASGTSIKDAGVAASAVITSVNNIAGVSRNVTIKSENIPRTMETATSGVSTNGGQWAKLVTINSTVAFTNSNIILDIVGGVGTASISARVHFGIKTQANLSTQPTVTLTVDDAVGISVTNFKAVVTTVDGINVITELWIQAPANFDIFYVYEHGRYPGSSTITYNNGATWNAALPAGTQTSAVANYVDVSSAQTITGAKTFSAATTTIGGTLNGVAAAFTGALTLTGALIAPTGTTQNTTTNITLGSNLGDFQIIRQHNHTGSVNGWKQYNFINRFAAGSDWTVSENIDGIGIDTSYLTPATTRTWIKRRPQGGLIAFGDAGTTYLSMTSTGASVTGTLAATGNISTTAAITATGTVTGSSFIGNVSSGSITRVANQVSDSLSSGKYARIATFRATGTNATAEYQYALASSNNSNTRFLNFVVKMRTAGTLPNNPAVSTITFISGASVVANNLTLINTVNDATGSTWELWVLSPTNYENYAVFEISEHISGGQTVTYEPNFAWVAAPTAAVTTGTNSWSVLQTTQIPDISATYVAIAGTQTITGSKTFSGGVSISNLTLTGGFGMGVAPGTMAANLGGSNIFPNAQMAGTSVGNTTSMTGRFTNDANGPYQVLAKSRGTTNNSMAAVLNADSLGRTSYQGVDSTAAGFFEAAYIGVNADGAPSTSLVPGQIVFATTPQSGSSVPTVKMTIRHNGDITMTNALTVTGAVTGASFSGSGTNLTALSGSNITSGTIAQARLSALITAPNATDNYSSTASGLGIFDIGSTTGWPVVNGTVMSVNVSSNRAFQLLAERSTSALYYRTSDNGQANGWSSFIRIIDSVNSQTIGGLKTFTSTIQVGINATPIVGNGLIVTADNSAPAMILNNPAAAAADGGNTLGFTATTSGLNQLQIISGWTGAASTDSYARFNIRTANTVVEALRLSGKAVSIPPGNFIYLGTGAGIGAPTVTTRSAGTKIVLWDSLSGISVDHAIGIASSEQWYSVPDDTRSFTWYAKNTKIASLSGIGVLQANAFSGFGAIGTGGQIGFTPVKTGTSDWIYGWRNPAADVNTSGMVPNGNFETTDLNAFSTFWSTGTGHVIARDTSNFNSGTGSLRMDNPGNAAGNVLVLQVTPFDVSAGDTVEITFVAKTSSTTNVPRIRMGMHVKNSGTPEFFAAGTVTLTETANTNLSTTWTNFTYTFVVPAGYYRARPYFRFDSGLGTAVPVTGYIDDLLIRVLSTTVPGGDSGWIAPTLTGGWANYGTSFANAGYRKVGNQVFLRGLIKNGTLGAAAFTLPVGYRPPADVLTHGTAAQVTTSNVADRTVDAVASRIDVNSAGNIVPVGNAGFVATAWISLDGISFFVD